MQFAELRCAVGCIKGNARMHQYRFFLVHPLRLMHPTRHGVTPAEPPHSERRAVDLPLRDPRQYQASAPRTNQCGSGKVGWISDQRNPPMDLELQGALRQASNAPYAAEHIMNICSCGVAIRRAVLNPGFYPGDTRRSEECRAAMEPLVAVRLGSHTGGVLSRPTRHGVTLPITISCQ